MRDRVSVMKSRPIFLSFYKTFWGFYHLLFSYYCLLFLIKITPIGFFSIIPSLCYDPYFVTASLFYLGVTLPTPSPSPTYPIVLDDNSATDTNVHDSLKTLGNLKMLKHYQVNVTHRKM